MPIASAMTAAHKDCPAVASVGQWPEILHLLPQGQIASADLPSRMHARTHNYNLNNNGNTQNYFNLRAQLPILIVY